MSLNRDGTIATVPYRKIQFWTSEYREFLCSKSTFDYLQAGGMTSLDGVKVTELKVMADMGNDNVVVRYYLEDNRHIPS